MATAAVSSSTCDQAEAVIARQLGGRFSPKTRLEALGTVGAVQLLLALEINFNILVDVDEVWPDSTLGGLVGLVADRVREAPAATARDAGNLIDLAARRAERARRARAGDAPPPRLLQPIALPPLPVDLRGEDAQDRMVRAMLALCAVGGFAAAIVTALSHP